MSRTKKKSSLLTKLIELTNQANTVAQDLNNEISGLIEDSEKYHAILPKLREFKLLIPDQTPTVDQQSSDQPAADQQPGDQPAADQQPGDQPADGQQTDNKPKHTRHSKKTES